MPIAGVILLIKPEKSDNILKKLKIIDGVTTYGVHKENNIVAVFETNTPRELENLSRRISDEIPGVLGIFPSYVNYEVDEDQDDNT